MSEQKPIIKADLAKRWGVSRPYLTRLAKPVSEGGKGMPEFTSLEEADAWRLINAPPRPGNSLRRPSPFAGEQSSPENQVEQAKKSPSDPAPTTPATPTAPGNARPTSAAAELMDLTPIDVRAMVRTDVDFDGLMLEHAQRVPQIAYGLFERAAATGLASVVSASTKNWHEASRAAADVRERFVNVQERTRALLPLDEVMDIVGTELQAVRSAIAKHGERCAAAANPADPALARKVIDDDIDTIFAALDQLAARTQRELAAPAA